MKKTPRAATLTFALLLPALPGCAPGQPAPPDGEADLAPAGDRPGARRPADVKPCYTPLSSGLPATAQFWSTFLAEDRAGRPAATQALRAAAQAHPQEEELALLLGLSQLWRVADPTDAEAKDMGGLVLAALGSRSELERAKTLCPSDHRLAAWLGPVLVNMGRGLNDQKMVARGLEVLDEGVAHYPSFVLFSRLLVYADRPRADPDFQKALQAVRDNITACGDVKTATDPACINSTRVPHNVEGAAVFLGDALAKGGLRDEALRIYRDGQAGPDHTAWPFRDVLAERLRTLDARLAAHADPDPANDPESAWSARYQCAICHQR